MAMEKVVIPLTLSQFCVLLFLLHHSYKAECAIVAVKHAGCLEIIINPIYEYYYGEMTSATVQECQETCYEKGFQFLGLKNGTHCRCANGGSLKTAKKSNNCTLPCKGDPLQTCGGTEATEAYRLITASGVSLEYVGCYDDGVARDEDNGTLVLQSQMTVERCALHCHTRGYRHSGIQNGSHCFCGSDNYGESSPRVLDAECDSKCSGDSLQMCGGSQQSSVYTINIEQPADGCFSDQKDISGFGLISNSSSNSRSDCVFSCYFAVTNVCSGFRYYGDNICETFQWDCDSSILYNNVDVLRCRHADCA